jgi:LuxR family transcriptional regulator, maltose regulon positive regulatory protein
MQGALTDARTQADAALRFATDAGWSDDVQTTSAHLTRVIVHLARADRDAAKVSLLAAGRVLELKPDAILSTCLRLAEVRLLTEDGQLDAARAELARVQAMVDERPELTFLMTWLGFVGAEIALAGAEPSVVLEMLPDQSIEEELPQRRVLRGRALLGVGEHQRALDEVRPLLLSSEADLPSVEAWLVTARAEHALRRDAAALAALTHAIERAVPEHLVRPLIASRGTLAPLLERYRRIVGPDRTPALVAEVLDQSASGPGRTASVDLRAPGAASSRAPAVEALTDRELAVLQLLSSMMTNSEIADELHVSVNTVKVHLKSLFRKLDASSRRDAVLRGSHLVGVPLTPLRHPPSEDTQSR